MPHRLHVPRTRQFKALEAEFGDPVDLLYGGADVAIGQAGEPDLPVGVMAAEVAQPFIVDAQHLVGCRVILDARGDAEDAEDNLGVDAVLLHLPNSEMRVAGTALAALAGIVEASLGHLVDAV